MRYELHLGDNREVLRSMPSDSVDSIVSDPPYELGFMGKRWDSTGIAYDVTLWAECLRVLKPGGHLLAFGGSRTYHRLAVAIEDAGFEIRDCIMWLYASGFPKSHDVSKALDKHGGVRAEFTAFRDAVIEALKRNGQTRSQLQDALGNYMISHYLTAASQPAVPNYRDYCIIRDFCKLDNEWDELFKPEAKREVITEKRTDMFGEYEVEDVRRSGIANKEENVRHTIGASKSVEIKETAPATPLAQQWQGWGTALKPAHEPIVVARKPLQGTVADNVQAWGVGALNIDGCRVGLSYGDYKGKGGGGVPENRAGALIKNNVFGGGFKRNKEDHTTGRWPANIILDEEAAQMLDEQSGVSRSRNHNRHNTGTPSVAKGKEYPRISIGHSDSGGASRFFYVAKASKAEREAGLEGMEVKLAGGMKASQDGSLGGEPVYRANHHPTVKPIALMRYLVRMVTPNGGIVLDPFMGSGTTGCAAMLEGMNFIGIDITPEYKEIAERRIQHWASQNPMGF